MKQLSILGSTGSIGRQCLSVVESLPGRFGVVALAAGANLEELVGQIARHHPEVVSVADAGRTDELSRLLRGKGISPLPDLHHGREGLLAVGTHPKADTVVSAAVGVVGLEATYEAVMLGKTVALSNKEVLVAAGELVMAAAKKAGQELLARRSTRRSSPRGSDRLGRAVSKDAPRWAGKRHSRAGSRASHLAHGKPHHHRFRNDDEQGF